MKNRVIVSVLAIVFASVAAPVGAAETSGPAAPVAAAQQGPAFETLGQAYKYRVDHAQTAVVPEGVNDPNCRANPQRREAVVLVHGTDTTMYSDFSQLGAQLTRAGWCVYGADYGAGPTPDKGYGWAPMEQSAQELDAVVAQARALSGADKVVLIGFSQGATVARWWMHENPGHAAQTAKWIGLASPTRGGNFYGLAGVVSFPWFGELARASGVVSPALAQLIAGSQFNARLNAQGETVPGPEYVTISTRFDEMMPEGHNSAIHGPGARNIVLQDVCPENHGGHMYMTYNPTVVGLVLAELDAAARVECVPVPLGFSIPEVVLFDAPRKLGGGGNRPVPVRLSPEIPTM